MSFTYTCGYNNPFTVPRTLPHIVKHYKYTTLKAAKKATNTEEVEEQNNNQIEDDTITDTVSDSIEEELRNLCLSGKHDTSIECVLSQGITRLSLVDKIGKINKNQGKINDKFKVHLNQCDPKKAVTAIKFLFDDTKDDKRQAEEKRLKQLGANIAKINNPCTRLARCINTSKGIQTSKTDQRLKIVLNESLKYSKKRIAELEAQPKHKWTTKNKTDYKRLLHLCDMINEYKESVRKEMRKHKQREIMNDSIGFVTNSVPEPENTAASFFDIIHTEFESNLPQLPGDKNKKKNGKRRRNGGDDGDDINPETKLEEALRKAHEDAKKTAEDSTTSNANIRLDNKLRRAANNTHQMEEFMVCIDKKEAGYYILNEKSANKKKRLKTSHIDSSTSSKNLKQSTLPFWAN